MHIPIETGGGGAAVAVCEKVNCETPENSELQNANKREMRKRYRSIYIHTLYVQQ